MPSRFEPCGLSQMYAQRFGSLPIGHQTGGLAETITDGETGFLFSQPSAESFLGGVRRAFEAFVAKDRLDAMRRSAMARSFSWDLSAACYSALYRKTDRAFHQRVIVKPPQADRRVSGMNSQITARPSAAIAASPVKAMLLPKVSLT